MPKVIQNEQSLSKWVSVEMTWEDSTERHLSFAEVF